jgi:hypothetical protein
MRLPARSESATTATRFVFAELALGTGRTVDGDLEFVLKATGEHRPGPSQGR